MQVLIWSGQPAPVGGWFVDLHGHRMLIRVGDLAPICPYLGPSTAQWRLVCEIPQVPQQS